MGFLLALFGVTFVVDSGSTPLSEKGGSSFIHAAWAKNGRTESNVCRKAKTWILSPFVPKGSVVSHDHHKPRPSTPKDVQLPRESLTRWQCTRCIQGRDVANYTGVQLLFAMRCRPLRPAVLYLPGSIVSRFIMMTAFVFRCICLICRFAIATPTSPGHCIRYSSQCVTRRLRLAVWYSPGLVGMRFNMVAACVYRCIGLSCRFAIATFACS